MILDENSFRKINSLIKNSTKRVEYLILTFEFSNDWVGRLLSEDETQKKIDYNALPSNNHKPSLSIIYEENETPQTISKELQLEIDSVFGGNVKNAFDMPDLFGINNEEIEELQRRRKSSTVRPEELKELLKYKYGVIIYDYNKSDYYIDYLQKNQKIYIEDIDKDLAVFDTKKALEIRDKIQDFENAKNNLYHHISLAVKSFTDDDFTQSVLNTIFQKYYLYDVQVIQSKLQAFYDSRKYIKELIKQIKKGLSTLDKNFISEGNKTQSDEDRVNNVHKILKNLIVKELKVEVDTLKHQELQETLYSFFYKTKTYVEEHDVYKNEEERYNATDFIKDERKTNDIQDEKYNKYVTNSFTESFAQQDGDISYVLRGIVLNPIRMKKLSRQIVILDIPNMKRLNAERLNLLEIKLLEIMSKYIILEEQNIQISSNIKKIFNGIDNYIRFDNIHNNDSLEKSKLYNKSMHKKGINTMYRTYNEREHKIKSIHIDTETNFLEEFREEREKLEITAVSLFHHTSKKFIKKYMRYKLNTESLYLSYYASKKINMPFFHTPDIIDYNDEDYLDKEMKEYLELFHSIQVNEMNDLLPEEREVAIKRMTEIEEKYKY